MMIECYICGNTQERKVCAMHRELHFSNDYKMGIAFVDVADAIGAALEDDARRAGDLCPRFSNGMKAEDILAIFSWLSIVGGEFHYEGLGANNEHIGAAFLIVDDDCNTIGFTDSTDEDWIHAAAEWIRQQEAER